MEDSRFDFQMPSPFAVLVLGFSLFFVAAIATLASTLTAAADVSAGLVLFVAFSVGAISMAMAAKVVGREDDIVKLVTEKRRVENRRLVRQHGHAA